MDQSQKDFLSEKRNLLQRKLYATEFVRRFVVYHWLEIYERLQNSGIKFTIESICTVSKDDHPFFCDALAAINHHGLSPELIKIEERSINDEIFEKYPSIDAFKYIMDIPLLHSVDQNFSELFDHSFSIPRFTDDILFLSPDWSPIVRLSWDDVVDHRNIFDDVPQSLIFTNTLLTKILFKSIEDEWRVLDH